MDSVLSDLEVQAAPSRGASVVMETGPIAVTTYLNASRYVQFDIYAQYNPAQRNQICPSYPGDVILMAGSRFLAGTVNTYAKPSSPYNKAASELGWCNAILRLQAETNVIMAGERLRVIIHPTSPEFVGMGTAGLNQSRIALPLYDAIDLAARQPGPVAPDGATTDTTGAADATGPGSGSSVQLGLLAVPSLFLVGRPKKGSLVFACAIMLALSGCTGKGSNAVPLATFGGQGDVVQKGTDSNAAANLSGTIQSDEGQPLGGALVSLLEVGLDRLSTGRGEFRFENISAKTVTLRVERTGYRVFQERLELGGGENRVEVTLEYADLRDAGARYHSHYDWLGEPSHVLMDEDIGDVACTRAGTAAPGGALNCASVTFAIPAEKDGRIGVVHPGTESLEVIFSWPDDTASPQLKYLQFSFRSIHNPANLTSMFPRGNGVPVRIATNWAMTDVGHQKYSLWAFTVRALPNSTTYAQDKRDATTSAHWGPVHVKVTAFRGGRIPLEPPHPDLFRQSTWLPVVEADFQAPAPACATICQFGGTNSSFPPKGEVGFVPSKTQWIDVSLSYSRDAVTPFTWWLGLKDAKSARANCVPGTGDTLVGYRQLGPGTPAGERTMNWRIAVGNGVEPDPFYAGVPSWCFWVWPSDENYYYADYCAKGGWCTDTFTLGPEYNRYPFFLHLNVTAYNTPMPASL